MLTLLNPFSQNEQILTQKGAKLSAQSYQNGDLNVAEHIYKILNIEATDAIPKCQKWCAAVVATRIGSAAVL